MSHPFPSIARMGPFEHHLPLEPMHVQAQRGKATAKFWMSPQISLVESYGMNSAELRELMRVAEKNRELIEGYLNEHLGV